MCSIIKHMIYKPVLVFFLLFLASVVSATTLETVKDLRTLKQQSETEKLPILLLFTADDCDYCDAIRQFYLIPMIQSGRYASLVLFRQLYVEEYTLIRDENGRMVGGDQIALKYNVQVTPTILFLDAQGNELVERIVGLSGADFFDHQLNQQISRLQKNIND
ncbi:hypothetical protein MNBD_GAMMA09-3301 [hydrothermal vent metagenome]|uniref:Thioredoxin domain-containing protein n=1 Tax=hydrothermal vent metagenome TaxID=652676 RepID=A0A3B0YAX1_9ZZZZ